MKKIKSFNVIILSFILVILSFGSSFANTEFQEFEPLNFSESASAYDATTTVYNDELYVAFREDRQVRVKKYDGSNWVQIDNGSLNYDKSQETRSPSIVVYKNEIYVAWEESKARNNFQIRMKKYNGTNWVSVDNGCLNYDSRENANKPRLIVYDSNLYVMWGEWGTSEGFGYHVRMKKYNGTNWVSVDNGSLNEDKEGFSHLAKAIVYNNNLYITWSQDDKIKVKKYDGKNWTSVDNGTINYDAKKSATYPNLSVYNNKLYVVFREDGQLRVKKYDGTNWEQADKGSLNYTSSKMLSCASFVEYNNELYVVFEEDKQVRLKKYDGTSWIQADNGPLNYKPIKYDESSWAVGTIYKNELYFIWAEARSYGKGDLEMKKLIK
ncbi:hypothetical protein [Tepidibacter hydrothermalis]|uniref:Uncharacterized protein n=1 Tax=Tepidibacter hydrothermalis TaxID=3036126 RepID=A0ABY8EAE2_9FIRM|nr:hypothetical protein [Tepidibacter hydrothermalis]WFD08774.1 hypothetical protein P4S50_10225 [Tepidibacter hydrothermalis]